MFPHKALQRRPTGKYLLKRIAMNDALTAYNPLKIKPHCLAFAFSNFPDLSCGFFILRVLTLTEAILDMRKLSLCCSGS